MSDSTNRLNISVSPHIRSPRTTQDIMLDVLIALLPTSIAGCFIFGFSAIALIVTCVCVAVVSEYLFCVITKRQNTASDLSAAVTGLLLALNISVNVPIWQAAVGTVFAVIFVKCIFGGIGKNFANPAITARIFMIIAFTDMASSASPVWEVVSSATPLPQLAAGNRLSILDLLLGNIGGAIGEVCTVALLLGAAYLLIRRVITWHAPICMIATVFIFSLLMEGFNFEAALMWILSGGLILGAFFMATDYVTTPTTALGKAIFGIGAGLITAVIRFFGNYPEGVSYAILIMNIVTPYIDRLTARRPFGAKGGKA